MMAAPAEAEQFTRELHIAARNDRDGLAQVLRMASAKMDLGVRSRVPLTAGTSARRSRLRPSRRWRSSSRRS